MGSFGREGGREEVREHPMGGEFSSTEGRCRGVPCARPRVNGQFNKMLKWKFPLRHQDAADGKFQSKGSEH